MNRSVPGRRAFTKEEKEQRVIIHALEDAYERIVQVGGNYYGLLSIEALKELIARRREELGDVEFIEDTRSLGCDEQPKARDR